MDVEPYTEDELLTLELRAKRLNGLSTYDSLRLINTCWAFLADSEEEFARAEKEYQRGFDDGYAAAERGE